VGIRSADIGSLTLLFRLPPQHVDDLVLGCDLFTQGGVLSRQVDHLERERLVSVAADALLIPRLPRLQSAQAAFFQCCFRQSFSVRLHASNPVKSAIKLVFLVSLGKPLIKRFNVILAPLGVLSLDRECYRFR